MKLKQLIDKYEWREIEPKIIELYPNQKSSIEGYKLVYETLSNLMPTKTDMQIVIENVIDDDFEYIDVSGRYQLENDVFNYGLDFVEWSEWLDMEIEPNDFSDLEIIVHCLWEITFYGFTKEKVQQVKNEVLGNYE